MEDIKLFLSLLSLRLVRYIFIYFFIGKCLLETNEAKKKNQLIFGKKRFSCTLVGAEERGSFREGSEKKRLRFLSR